MIADSLRPARPARDDRSAGRHEVSSASSVARWPASQLRHHRHPHRPTPRQTILDEGQKKADRIEKNYRMGAITDQERYAQLIDIWGHARKQVTEDLMDDLENDYRDDEGRPVAREDRKQARSSISTPST